MLSGYQSHARPCVRLWMVTLNKNSPPWTVGGLQKRSPAKGTGGEGGNPRHCDGPFGASACQEAQEASPLPKRTAGSPRGGAVSRFARGCPTGGQAGQERRGARLHGARLHGAYGRLCSAAFLVLCSAQKAPGHPSFSWPRVAATKMSPMWSPTPRRPRGWDTHSRFSACARWFPLRNQRQRHPPRRLRGRPRGPPQAAFASLGLSPSRWEVGCCLVTQEHQRWLWAHSGLSHGDPCAL